MHFSSDAVNKHSKIKCAVKHFDQGDDDVLSWHENRTVKDGDAMETDFGQVARRKAKRTKCYVLGPVQRQQ